MRWTFGRKRVAAIAVAAMSTATWVGLGGGTGAGAYARWSLLACDAPTTLAYFLEDSPGAGANQESVFLGLPNATDEDETCIWDSPVPASSTDHLSLTVRAAVNDGTRLTVSAHDPSGAKVAATSAFTANSAFSVATVPLPLGRVVQSVRFTLTDHTPGSVNLNRPVASGRSSALVDEMSIHNSDGLTLWRDGFAASG